MNNINKRHGAMHLMHLLGVILVALGFLGLLGTNILFTLPPIGFGALVAIGEYILLKRARR